MKVHNLLVTGSLTSGGENITSISSSVSETISTVSSSISASINDLSASVEDMVTNMSSSFDNTMSTMATTGSNLFVGTQTISGSIIPAVDNTYDLGTATQQFRDLYLSSASLYIDGTKVLGSTSQELQITTDVGQSFKILEDGSDTITLQSGDGNITLASSGGGDVILDPTNGIIALKGTTTIYAGNRVLSSDGNNIHFGNGVTMTGSLTVSGYIETQELRTTYISSSILYRSGSTKFGDEISDTHDFTGSLNISGSVFTNENITITNENRPYFITKTTSPGEEAGIKIQQSNVSDWYIGTAQGTSTATDLSIRDVKNSRIPFSISSSTGDITINQKLGVGYSSPIYQLQVLNTIGLRSNSQNFQVIKGTGWGYDTSSYRVVMLGDDNLSNFTTISIGYDPSGNTNGSFSGDGREILLRRGAQFATPNSTNDGYYLYNLTLLDGKVGIGTNTPEAKLTIDGTSSGAYIRINNASSGDVSSGLLIYNGSNLDTSIYTNPTFGNTTLLTREKLVIRAGGSQRAVLSSVGDLSVGTNNSYVGGAPGNTNGRLNIYTDNGSSAWAQQIRHDSTTGNGLFLRAGNSASYWTAYFTGFDENNVHLAVRGDGNIGMGTDSPDGKLDVVGDISYIGNTNNSVFVVRNNASYTAGQGSGTSLIVQYGGQNIVTLGNTGTGQRDAILSMRDEGVVKVRIAANNSRGGDTIFNGGGNVAIGTDTASQKLTVAGGFYTSGDQLNDSGYYYAGGSVFLKKLLNVGDNTTTTLLTFNQNGSYTYIGGGEILIVFVDPGSPWGVYVWKGLISIRTVQFGSLYSTGIQEISSRSNLDGTFTVSLETSKTGGVPDAIIRVVATTSSGISGTAHVSFNGWVTGGLQPV